MKMALPFFHQAVGPGLLSLFVVAGLAGCAKSESVDAKAETISPEASHSSGLINVTTDTFKAEVEEAEGLVMVDFWAAWCGPCRMIAPSLEELSKEFEGTLKICKVDIDRNRDLAVRFKTEAIPYVALFKDGQLIDARIGARQKAEYQSWITANL